MGGFNKYGSSDNYVLLGGGGDKLISDFIICNNGHDYVEIGGLKWATMNIGASKVTDPGLYYQWGDINGYTIGQCSSSIKYFSWKDYKYGNNTTSPGNSMTRYNGGDSLTQLDIVDDIARRNWGGSWRMPTSNEFQALINAVNITLTDNYQGSGVRGIICTDKTDSSKVLFFPALGYCTNGSNYSIHDEYMIEGRYWSSSLNRNNVQSAYCLEFNADTYPSGSTPTHIFMYCNMSTERYCGCPVRGVIG